VNDQPEKDDPGSPAGGPGEAETAPGRQSTPFLVLQFFIFPMAIVAVSVAVFVVFGLIAAEGRSARDYVQEVRSGGTNRRWQAAFELSKIIQSRKDPALEDERFVPELVALFEDAQKDDPRVRRYLALALGKVGDARAVPALLKAVGPAGADSDAEALVYSIWALGAIRDERALPELLRLSAVEDAGIRKAAVHALGSLPGEASAARLRESLQDGAEDVRWNAALALAHRGDAACVPVILGMLDRSRLGSVPGLTPEQREDAILQAVSAAAGLSQPDVTAALEVLRDSDPSLKVREATRAALGSRATPQAH
jgi:HEAT repeat protein